MKKIMLMAFIIIFMASSAFSAGAGKWGLSANTVIWNYENVAQVMNTYEDITQITYSGVFYQWSDDISFDLGFALIDQETEGHIKTYINSYCLRSLYNLGKGNIIPHIGAEYINTIGKLWSSDFSFTSISLILGLEITVIKDLSIMADLKAVSTTTINIPGDTIYANSVNMVPTLGIRWYL
jgi:hypothetical protein